MYLVWSFTLSSPYVTNELLLYNLHDGTKLVPEASMFNSLTLLIARGNVNLCEQIVIKKKSDSVKSRKE